MKEKSKILKLKKKYNKYLWLEENLGKSCITVGVISGLGMVLSVIINNLFVCITSASLFGLSFTLGLCSIHFLNNLFNNKRFKVDNEIEILMKEDAEEKQILDEYVSIQKIKKESKKQINEKNKLITKLIHKKNSEAKEYNELVKSLTKKKKAEAKQEAIKEVEQKRIIESVVTEQTDDYSRTKVAKIYAEKSKEQNEEIQNSVN